MDTERMRAIASTAPARDIRKDLHKACQEIDSLRAEIEGKEKDLSKWDKAIERPVARVYELKAELEQERERVRELEEVRNAARALMDWRPEHEVRRDSAIEFMRLENALREALANSEKESDHD